MRKDLELLGKIDAILEPETSEIMQQLDALEEQRKQIPGSSRERFEFVRDMAKLQNQLQNRTVSGASTMEGYEKKFEEIKKETLGKISVSEAKNFRDDSEEGIEKKSKPNTREQLGGVFSFKQFGVLWGRNCTRN